MAILPVGLALLAPLPAAADHETVPPQEPPPRNTTTVSDPAPVRQAEPYYFIGFDMGGATNSGTDAGFEADLGLQVGLDLGFGYRFGIISLEGELYARSIRVNSLDLGAAPPFPVDDYGGGVWTSGLMGNLIVDLPVPGQIRPYLGVGYGISRVSARYGDSLCFIVCAGSGNYVVDDYDIVMASQAMAGLRVSEPSKNVEMFLGYRYFATDDLEFSTIGGTGFRQDGIRSHIFSVGIRFKV
jgi:opacity protein-like surface antigen